MDRSRFYLLHINCLPRYITAFPIDHNKRKAPQIRAIYHCGLHEQHIVFIYTFYTNIRIHFSEHIENIALKVKIENVQICYFYQTKKN